MVAREVTTEMVGKTTNSDIDTTTLDSTVPHGSTQEVTTQLTDQLPSAGTTIGVIIGILLCTLALVTLLIVIIAVILRWRRNLKRIHEARQSTLASGSRSPDRNQGVDSNGTHQYSNSLCLYEPENQVCVIMCIIIIGCIL